MQLWQVRNRSASTKCKFSGTRQNMPWTFHITVEEVLQLHKQLLAYTFLDVRNIYYSMPTLFNVTVSPKLCFRHLLFLYLPVEPDEFLVAESAVSVPVVHLDHPASFVGVEAEFVVQYLVSLGVADRAVSVDVVARERPLYVVHASPTTCFDIHRRDGDVVVVLVNADDHIDDDYYWYCFCWCCCWW